MSLTNSLTSPRTFSSKYPLRLLPVAILFATSLPSGATMAHSVYTYAWLEGQQICTESYYSRTEKVLGGDISMLGPEGVPLATAKTDAKGNACFDAPETAMPLTFVLHAGQGHQAHFSLTENEVRPAVTMRTNSAPQPQTQQTPATTAPGLDAQALRQIVREELQSQLGPIRQKMAQDATPPSPGIREIGGGIGWIVGLSALVGMFYGRRKDSLPPGR